MEKATMSILASAVIAAGLVAATSAFADEPTTPSTDPSTDTVVVSPGDFQPVDPGNLGDMKVSLPIFSNNSIFGQADSSKHFDIPAGKGWVKVWINNAGSHGISFTLNQGTDAGPQKMSGYVGPHGQQAFYSRAPLSTGLFYLNFSRSGDMHGSTMGVRIGSDLNELKRN